MAGSMRWGRGNVEDLEIIQVIDSDPDLSWLEDESRYEGLSQTEADKYREQDKERLASYGSSWHMIGIRARAKIRLSNGASVTVESPGLWGIESDSERSYLRQVGEDEYLELKKMVGELGVTLPPLSAAQWIRD